VAEPTWTVPADLSADWSPAWLGPETAEVAEDEPACWPPLVELHELATHTGALTFTGADAATAGSTSADPSCAVAIEPSADWLASEPEPPFVLADAPPSAWAPVWSSQVLATHTGASMFAGASAEAAGEAFPEPTWTVTTEWSLDCPWSASAGPAVARAISIAPSVKSRFMVPPCRFERIPIGCGPGVSNR
jgi:hypothetical protein